MARSIYCKFSDNRNRENSIKTIIREDFENRVVIKESIFDEGISHIHEMHEKTSKLKAAYPNIKIGNSTINGTSLHCEYIDGSSMMEFYNRCIIDKDKEGLLTLIDKHVEIVTGTENNECLFFETKESRQTFGDLSYFEGKKALKITNFEATANNIFIAGKNIYFIDYEWIFDFPVPYDLILYHCIVWTSFANMKQLAEIISMDEMIKYLNIDTEIMRGHNYFFKFITVDKNGSDYCLFKEKYVKGKYSIYDLNKIWEKRIEQQQKYIVFLEEGQKNQQEYISNLERDLRSQNEYVQEIEEKQKNQQEYIGNLERDLKSQNEYVQEIEEKQKNQQEYISNLERDLKSQNEYVQEIEEKQKNQQEYISNLERDLKSQNEYVQKTVISINQLKEHLEQRERENGALKLQIGDKEQEIVRLEEMNIGYQTSIQNLEETLSVQNRHVTNLENIIERCIDLYREK